MIQTFEIVGMTCEGCRSHVEESLNSVEGVVDAVVDLKNNAATIEIDLYITQLGCQLPLGCCFLLLGYCCRH